MRRLGSQPRGPISAQTRIVGWLALLVSFALLAMVVVVGRVVIARVESGLEDELAHEGAKLRAFADRGVDPETGQPFRSAAELLDAFLRDNLPDEDETFFSVVDGKARSRSPQAPAARLDRQRPTVAAAARAETAVFGSTDTAAGPARYAVFPLRVRGDPSRAALVAVEFAAPARAQAWQLVRLLGAAGFGALAAAALGSWLVAGRVLAPIRVVREAASRIGESDLGERLEVTGDDEVAHLAHTFNHMLDRLETAFDGQRRFLDDASHELRTPLTVVRGHLELMGDDPADREQTRALVLDELDRMTRLVDDLMLLARAGQPGFVRLGPVDLADLVVEVAAKSRPLGSRRWVIDELAEAVVPADGQRLTQALLQLAANAVAHTDEDDIVGFGASVDDGVARIWVRDSGTGIEPAKHDQVFRRTTRGAADRRSQGLGLGLAIVSSIAEAHGGSVRLDSAVGVGSRFTLELPGGDSSAGDSALVPGDAAPDHAAPDHAAPDQEAGRR